MRLEQEAQSLAAKFRWTHFCILFISLVVSGRIFAAIGFEDAVFPEIAVSARALAMGNAFINRVDDSASAFYNPAGLGTFRGRRPRIHLSNLHAEMNRGLMKMTTGGRITDVGSNFTKGFSLDKTRTLLLDNRGKLTHSKFHLMPNMTFRFFTAGYVYAKQARSTLGQETGAEFEYAERTDHGPYAGMNISLLGGVIKFGASAILLTRKEAIGSASDTETLNLSDDQYSKGTGLFFTGGVRVTLPWSLLPTFSLVMHNVGGMKFSQTGSDTPITEIESSVDIGFSVTPQLGKVVRLHIELNYKDVGGAYAGVKSANKIGFGIELDIARVFFIRGGYGDGWGSGGVGVKGKHFQFDITSYAVDTSSSEFRGKEDRRLAISLSSGF